MKKRSMTCPSDLLPYESSTAETPEGGGDYCINRLLWVFPSRKFG